MRHFGNNVRWMHNYVEQPAASTMYVPPPVQPLPPVVEVPPPPPPPDAPVVVIQSENDLDLPLRR